MTNRAVVRESRAGRARKAFIGLPLAALVLTVAAVSAACGQAGSTSDQVRAGVTFEVVANPPGTVKQVAWVDDWIVAQTYDMTVNLGEGWTSRLFVLPDSGAGDWHMLPGPSDGLCGADGFYAQESPMRFGAGTLAMVQRCSIRNKNGEPNTAQAGEFVVSQFRSGAISRPRETTLPRFGVQSIFDSEIDGAALTSAEDAGLITRNASISQLREILSSNGKLLAQGLGSDRFSQVWGLSASATDRVAFIGYKGPQGPPAQLTASLFVSGFDLKDPVELVHDVRDLFGTGWSADGKWIAFGGEKSGVEGLYVVNVDTKKVLLVSKGVFFPTASSWSPTDMRIAVVDKTGSAAEQTIKIFDASKLVGP